MAVPVAETAAVVAEPQLPLAAEQHQQQARLLVEPELRRHLPQRRPRGAELRRRMERKRPPVAEDVPLALAVRVEVAAGVVAAISPAPPTLMAHSTPISPRSLAIRTACRR